MQQVKPPNEKAGCVPALALLGAVLVGAFLIYSYRYIVYEDPPYRPRYYFQSPESVIVKPVSVNSVRPNNKPLLTQDARVAVLLFQSPDKTQGGALLSDMFSSTLMQMGLKPVERDNIEKILAEQDLGARGRAALSDLEIAAKLGKILSVDVMIFGAVTVYKTDGQLVYIPVRINDEDRKTYSDQYEKYRQWYLYSWWCISCYFDRIFYSDYEKHRLQKLRAVDGILSLGELEEELKKTSRQEFHSIAVVGVTAKLVNVRTASIEWMGQGETVDVTIVNGAARIINALVVTMQKQ